MDYLGIGTFLASLAGQGAAAQQRSEAMKRTEAFYKPGAGTGTVKPDENIDFSTFDPAYFSDPGTQARFHAMAETQPGLLDQTRADQSFKNKYLPQYRQQMTDFENGAAGKANRRVGEIIASGGQAIDQGTLNKMVAQFIDQNSANAAANNSAVDADIAARGLSPDAAYEARAGVAHNEQAQNAADTRDVTVKAALANKDYEAQILDMAQRLGAQYAAQRGGFLDQIAGLDAPPDFAGMGINQAAYDQMKLDALNNINLSNGTALQNFSDGLISYAAARDAARRQAQAAQAASRNSWMGPLASVAGGVASGAGAAGGFPKYFGAA